MPTTDTSSKTAEEFLSISNKRLALECLIKIAAGIHNQQAALTELALAAKPSQKFSGKVVSFYGQLAKRMKDVSVSEIIQKLDTIEAITQRSFSQLIQLTTLDVDQLRDNEIESINVDEFSDAITNFKRRTQTALAFRILLNKRGVAIHPLKLPVSQEEISEQIENLKHKEHQCVQKVKKEINDIVSETKQLLSFDNLEEEMKLELVNVQNAMEANLNHLDKGGSVLAIPYAFEVISIETEHNDTSIEDKESEQSTNTPSFDDTESSSRDALLDPGDKSIEIEQSTDDSKSETLSFWQLLKAWLFSPWSTSWRSLKSKQQSKK